MDVNSFISSLDVQLSSGIDHRRDGRIRSSPNPYYKYLLKLESSKRTQLGPKLSEKSEKLTCAIIANFLDWYNSLGGVDISIDESMLRNLFRVGFDEPRIQKTKERPLRKTNMSCSRTNQQHVPNKKHFNQDNKCPSYTDGIWNAKKNLWAVQAFAVWLHEKHPEMHIPESLADCKFKWDEDDNESF